MVLLLQKKKITRTYLNPVTRDFKKKDIPIALALIRLSLLSRSRSQTIWPSVEFRREICEWALVTRAFWMETDGLVFTRAALCSGTGCGCGRRGCMLIFILFNSFFSPLEEIRGGERKREYCQLIASAFQKVLQNVSTCSCVWPFLDSHACLPPAKPASFTVWSVCN